MQMYFILLAALRVYTLCARRARMSHGHHMTQLFQARIRLARIEMSRTAYLEREKNLDEAIRGKKSSYGM